MRLDLVEDDKKIKLRKVIYSKPIAKFAKKLTRNKKDCVISITGATGEGKSVLAVHIAKEYDRKFDYDRNLIYSREELKEKIESFKPSAFIIDEAINVVYKREWNKGSQKDLIKLLNICRSKGHLLIFVQPSFTDMDKDVRNERIRLWIYVKKRGIGVVFRPIRNIYGSIDPFKLEENNKIVKKYIDKMGELLGTLEGSYRTDNFLNFIRWDNLDKEEYQRYEYVKDNKKYANDEEVLLTKKDAEKLARDRCFELIALLKSKRFMKMGFYKYVSAFFNISQSAVSTYIKRSEITQSLNNNKDKEYKEEKAIKI
jgi:hypothetical protein